MKLDDIFKPFENIFKSVQSDDLIDGILKGGNKAEKSLNDNKKGLDNLIDGVFCRSHKKKSKFQKKGLLKYLFGGKTKKQINNTQNDITFPEDTYVKNIKKLICKMECNDKKICEKIKKQSSTDNKLYNIEKDAFVKEWQSFKNDVFKDLKIIENTEEDELVEIEIDDEDQSSSQKVEQEKKEPWERTEDCDKLKEIEKKIEHLVGIQEKMLKK